MELTTSVQYVRLMMNYVKSIGLTPDMIFHKAGLDISILDNPRLRISIVKFGKIWLAIEENSRDPDLGLHLGEKIFNFPGHIVFMLMLNSATVKDAMDKFCQYFNLLTYMHSPHISVGKTLAEMELRYNVEGLDMVRHANEAVLAGYASILYRLTEHKLQIEAVHFTHPQPDGTTEHRRIFDAPVFFDQPDNKLVFNSEYLTLPLVVMSNQNLLENLEQKARDLQQKLQVDGLWSDKVNRMIFIMLGREKIDIETVADKLAISPRNLQHKLRKDGVAFQELLDHVRKEMAKYLLEYEMLPINEIALNLGYSEHSVFTRAFKKWVGVTPKQYRAKFG